MSQTTILSKVVNTDSITKLYSLKSFEAKFIFEMQNRAFQSLMFQNVVMLNHYVVVESQNMTFSNIKNEVLEAFKKALQNLIRIVQCMHLLIE